MRGLGILLVCLLAGCASDQDRLRESGFSVSYAQGYDDGCHSGRRVAGGEFDHMRRDQMQFDNDSDYRQGWEDAFKVCERDAERVEEEVQNDLRRQQQERQQINP